MRAPARPTLVALALLCSGLVGCAPSSRPYRFSSPLIGGAELPSGRDARAGGDAPDRAGAQRDRRAGKARAPKVAMAPVRSTLDPDAVTRHRGGPAAPPRGASQAASRSSTAPRAAPPGLGAEATPEDPRSWVGVRDEADPLQAVLALCRRRNPRCPQAEAELTLLRQRDAWLPASTAFTVGDLLLFDRVGLDNGEQIFALVTARQARGVYELAYLAAGVWRRGLIDPARPRLHRDRSGAVVNTFLRHRRAVPPKGTRFLTGELLVGVLPLGGSDAARTQLARW